MALIGEYVENEVRKDFTQSERVDIAKAVEEELGERRGRPSKENVQNFAQLENDNGKKTVEIAAQKAGFGNKETYRQAKKVVGKITIIDWQTVGQLLQLRPSVKSTAEK